MPPAAPEEHDDCGSKNDQYGSLILAHAESRAVAWVLCSALADGIQRRLCRCVTRFGRKKTQSVVAPVVGQATLQQMTVLEKMMHRHKFNRGDTELLQVFQDRLRREARVGAAQVFRHFRVQLRKTSDVSLVDDGVAPRPPQKTIMDGVRTGSDRGQTVER